MKKTYNINMKYITKKTSYNINLKHVIKLIIFATFHPTFHSHDIISNVRTSNFEWFNKTKMLCKIIIKKITYQIDMSLNGSEEDSDHLSKLQTFSKHFLKCVSILHNEFLYYVLERTQLMSSLYPLLCFTSAWLFIARVYRLWQYHLQNHVGCHLWFDIQHVGWHVQTI